MTRIPTVLTLTLALLVLCAPCCIRTELRLIEDGAADLLDAAQEGVYVDAKDGQTITVKRIAGSDAYRVVIVEDDKPNSKPNDKQDAYAMRLRRVSGEVFAAQFSSIESADGLFEYVLVRFSATDGKPGFTLYNFLSEDMDKAAFTGLAREAGIALDAKASYGFRLLGVDKAAFWKFLQSVAGRIGEFRGLSFSKAAP